MNGLRAALAWLLLLLLSHGADAAGSGDIPAYHGDAARSGNFVVPNLTPERAEKLHRDPSFHATIKGHVYAQPLYWHGRGRDELIVATEDDTVYALDAATGATIWKKKLGRPVSLSSLPCGDIDPLGITGTPVIDAASGTLYLDAMLRDAKYFTPKHEIFALSLADGHVMPGWPIDLTEQLGRQGFVARAQNQRGALAILDGKVYVPFGGNTGDCALYHGWVVGAKLDDPHAVASWRTAARSGGIWAPAGISSDGLSLFVATGNTMDAQQWGGGEAIIRLDGAPSFSGKPKDFFVPRDWRRLDAEDADLGGVAPILFDQSRRRFVLALGKDGKAYLLDRDNLGGFGGSLAEQQVSHGAIITSAATYPTSDGTLVAFHATGIGCKDRDAELAVLRIRSGAVPSISTAWCGKLRGAGAPIVTTTDGRNNPIVWMLGAEGDNRLHGFRGDTGAPIYVSAPLSGLRRFDTLIATRTHLYVAADDAVYAFGF